MKRRILGLLAALTIATGVAVVVDEAPAQATSYWSCASGVACVHTGFSGAGLDMTIPIGQYGVGICHNFNSDFTNTISSMSNDFGNSHHLLLFNDSNCNWNGLYYDPPSDHGAWNFNTIHTLIDDNMANSFLIA